MIEYITGELVSILEDGIVVELNGIGYKVMMPLSSIDNLPSIGSFVKIHTYLYVREDLLALYGFLSRDDLGTFKLLITVSGIGPKVALAVLSTITSDDLRFAVLSEDVKTITKAPGIGTKTAKKLILELKDKFELEESFESRLANNNPSNSNKIMNVRSETIEALTVLGYSVTDASKIVRNISIDDNMTAEDVLKLSLKQLL